MPIDKAIAQLNLEELREKWQNATTESERIIIELQALPIKIILRRKEAFKEQLKEVTQ